MSKPTVVVSLLLFAVGCSEQSPAPVDIVAAPEFVGSDQCDSCHKTEYEDWQGSHHQLAMQVANDSTVLGDFSDIEFDYFDTKTRLFMRDQAFMVRTENAVGEQQEFEITHTFGVTPLQQYLVEFPGGRKQSLPFTWDSRPQGAGGQRWYHLYPDEYIAPDDPLHWTGQYFRWNTMCAECHSTDLDVGYDVESNSFNTTFSEISVGCESCHGPGSTHIEQAHKKGFDVDHGLTVDLDDRRDAAWIMNPDTGIARRSEAAIHQQQPESCGRCHSRRGVITANYEYGKPLTDTHMLALLEENLYHADGRIQDEVYVYGSFIQSKMYAAGVTCGDCHNPHSGTLHAGANPNDTCAQCHLPSTFASADHAEADVGNCVSCHMPATTYMGVDDRRDHSFRLPNTDQQTDHYGTAIAAGRAGNANTQLLDALTIHSYPAIARATMLTLLEPPLEEKQATLLLENLDSADPLLRIAALRSLRNHPAELRMRSGSHLLRDAVRGVRIEAVLTYLDYRDLLPVADARAYGQAADDYRSALQATLSDPLSATNLAEFESRSGNDDQAGLYHAHAISLDPNFAPARHAYGLFLVRAGESEEALVNLRKAAILEPRSERFVYVLGVALNSLGLGDDALRVLTQARTDFPDNFDIAWALATMLRDVGDYEAAVEVLEDLLRQYPNNAQVRSLFESLTTAN